MIAVHMYFFRGASDLSTRTRLCVQDDVDIQLLAFLKQQHIMLLRLKIKK